MRDLRDFSFAQSSLAESRMKWAAVAQVRGAAFTLLLGTGSIVFGSLDPRFKMILWIGGLFAAYGLYGLIRAKLPSETKRFRLCPHRGYNITGNTTGRCPECGKFI